MLRVGGAFPQLYLNGQPEEVEDASTPWSELEDIVYAKDQFLIIGEVGGQKQFEFGQVWLSLGYLQIYHGLSGGSWWYLPE